MSADKPRKHETTVTLDAVVTYRYEPGAPEHIPAYNHPDNYDPGSAPIVDIISIKAGTVDITARLDAEALEEIRHEILNAEEIDF